MSRFTYALALTAQLAAVVVIAAIPILAMVARIMHAIG